MVAELEETVAAMDSQRGTIGGQPSAAVLFAGIMFLAFGLFAYEMAKGDSGGSGSSGQNQMEESAEDGGLTPTASGETREAANSTSSTPALVALGHTATVDRGSARFTFPLEPGRIYRWSNGGKVHGLEVEVDNGRHRYILGFSLFTPMGATPEESGKIGDMLEAGQFEVGRHDPDGMVSEVTSQEIEYQVLDNGALLEITVKGTPTLALLFSGQPSSVRFIETDEFQERSITIPVTYLSGIPAQAAQFTPDSPGK